MKQIIILGGGESGVGAAILAKVKGFDVFISDKNSIKKKYKKISFPKLYVFSKCPFFL